ncbi:hypothetical protein NQ315_017183 [Exocentrus adspersus]|uniref:Uncharacterized protein n=1 Tax=Exocentrus adspersus TaxID=1586481 RepID=A0AAV8VGT3_9CUCU|nr:hypothetical protein NQ315_017183 [Exocentrus adspersus]
MVADKKEKKQKNKGVNAKPGKAINDNLYFSDTDTLSQALSPLTKVKRELQTVIDLMGPSTPQFLRSSSNDGDNEFSTTSDTTNKSSDKTNEEDPSVASSQNTTDNTVPPDITLQEDTDYSVVANKNSTTLDTQIFHECSIPQYVCPPPMLPANIVYNSECMCPQIANYIQREAVAAPYLGGVQKDVRKLKRHKNFLYNIFKNLSQKYQGFIPCPEKGEYYTMNVKECQGDVGPPKRLVFDLVSDKPKPNYMISEDYGDFGDSYFNPAVGGVQTKDQKNINNEQLSKEVLVEHRESNVTFEKNSKNGNQKTVYTESEKDATRVDVYYFDHGDAGYLKTTDSPPVVTTEHLAERTEAYTTRFWAEIFGTLHIGVSFCISFVLQLFRFLLYSLFRPLTVGLIQLGTDYFLKPCIAILFNAIVQPPLIFLYNVSTSFRDICRPLAEAMGFFLREMAVGIRAFRIIDFRREKVEKITENEGNNRNKDEVDEKIEENK